MAIGPGKYDDLCTLVRKTSGAVGAVVIVAEGKLGTGFSVQGPMDLHLALPTLLRRMADEIEDDLRKRV